MKNNNNTYVEVEGYKNWIPYFEFTKEKYSDISISLMQKDFEVAKRAMRELIDNTVPYHSTLIEVEEKSYIDYADYFELCVDEYQRWITKEGSRHLTPDEKEKILEQKDKFYKDIRFIRRFIMKDLAKAGIIPTAQTKKEQKVNSLLRSQ